MITETTSPVASQMPAGTALRVFKVPSSDRKSEYYVQVVRYRQDHAAQRGLTTCSCPSGFNNLPLTIAGVKPLCCKHAEEVYEFLKKEETK